MNITPPSIELEPRPAEEPDHFVRNTTIFLVVLAALIGWGVAEGPDKPPVEDQKPAAIIVCPWCGGVARF